MMSSAPMTWSEVCSSEEFRGRWVALDGCRYDEATAKLIEGTVVDVDDDVVAICNRVRDAEYRDCAIHFIEGRRTSSAHASSGALH